MSSGPVVIEYSEYSSAASPGLDRIEENKEHFNSDFVIDQTIEAGEATSGHHTASVGNSQK